MKIEADARVAFPRDAAFRAYRDELPSLVPYLPNVRSIEVKETEVAPGGVATRIRKLNLWRAKADIPSVARSIIKPEMLGWDDHALWDEADWTCEWKVVPHFFTDRITCGGRNRYLADGNSMVVQIRGDLDVDAKGLPGVPRLLAGTVAAAIEKFVVLLLTPNLTSVSRGLDAYLKAKVALVTSLAVAVLLQSACPRAASADNDAGPPRDDAGDHDAGAPPDDDAGAPPDDDAGAPPEDDAGSAPEDAGAEDPFGGYDRPGPAAVTMVTRTVDLGGLSPTELDVYLPSGAGARPVVSLSPGLLQPREAYRPYGERLASHGIIVVVRDDPGVLTDTQTVTDDIVTICTDWLAAENGDSQSPLFGRVDTTRLGLAGHSRGGKASLLAAEQGLHDVASAWFGLDPVDAAEFAGGAMARDALPSLGMPTAFLGAEISSSCSPAGDNYAVLFAQAPTPSVELVALAAGHTQLQDQDHCVGCAACSPYGTADDAAVLAAAVRYLTAFFARELLSDASVGAGLEGAGAAVDIAAGRITRSMR